MKNFRLWTLGIVAFYIATSMSCGQNFPCDMTLKKVYPDSQLECLQGVFQIKNDDNPNSENYQITKGYKLMVVYLGQKGDITSLSELSTGFQGFIEADQLKNVCELESSGQIYINVPEKRVTGNGVVSSYYKNSEFYCEAGIVEYFTRKLMYMNKLTFLPFRAYKEIKNESHRSGRNYLEEFDILSYLKVAKVKVDRVYFHDRPDNSSKRKAFVVKNDIVIVDEIRGGWIRVAYEGEKLTTEGWVELSNLDLLE